MRRILITGFDTNSDISLREKDNKDRIALLVTAEEKLRWQDFAENKKSLTLSKLIRTAMEFYISLYSNFPEFESFSKISHDLKEPLTAIMGYVHLLIEKYKDKISSDILFALREILENCSILEGNINASLETDQTTKRDSSFDLLVVDDDVTTLKILINYCELKGVRCKGLSSGINVVQEIETGHPSLVFLDVILPEISGFDICQLIKSNPATRATGVYYCSAIPGFEIEKKLAETGADGYISKPFNFEMIETILSSISKNE